ncbi:hypothetical protein GQ457_08G004710 [Hibiscus cannabinus]
MPQELASSSIHGSAVFTVVSCELIEVSIELNDIVRFDVLAAYINRSETFGAIKMGQSWLVVSHSNQLQTSSERSRFGVVFVMERVARMLLISAIVLVALASNSEGRVLKEEDYHPQNFLGGFGTSGGLVPTPGGGVGLSLGPTVVCSFPGTGCVRIQPTIPGGTGTVGAGTPP